MDSSSIDDAPGGRPPVRVLIGPQRHQPTLPEVVARHGLDQAPIATLTAGWQEREAEDDELQTALGGLGRNLRLHARTEHVFSEDRELFAAHRRKQDKLRQLQSLYRMRLGPLLVAARRLQGLRADANPTTPVASALLEPELGHALAAVRTLDDHHLARVTSIQTEFEDAVQPWHRPVVAAHRGELAEVLAGCRTLAIAGGHVATLINRMRLFGLAELIEAAPTALALVGWSAGAMALTRRIVLFHDFVPGGGAHAEVLGPGLGLCPELVVLPDAAHRLALDDTGRVELFARRAMPEQGITLDDGDVLVWTAHGWRADCGRPVRLLADGAHDPLPSAPREVR